MVDYKCNYITFWDDLSFASLPQAERFADAILHSGMKFNWNAAVRVDLFGNPKHSRERRLEVAKKFKAAGCRDLGFSLESANKEKRLKLKSMQFEFRIKKGIENNGAAIRMTAGGIKQQDKK